MFACPAADLCLVLCPCLGRDISSKTEQIILKKER